MAGAMLQFHSTPADGRGNEDSMMTGISERLRDDTLLRSRLANRWNDDAALRREFGGNFEAYRAYETAFAIKRDRAATRALKRWEARERCAAILA